MTKDEILEAEEYLVTYKYTLPTGSEILWEGLFMTGKQILAVVFPENDPFNHILISCEVVQ